MTIYALCTGSGLDDCANCKRLAEKNPKSAASPYQAWIPACETEHCGYWLPIQQESTSD